MITTELKKDIFFSELLEEAGEDDTLFFVRYAQHGKRFDAVIRFSEGSGDNLDEDDLEAGYDSYVDFDFERDGTLDGGMYLYNSHEKTFEEVCSEILCELFGKDAVTSKIK